MKASHTFTSVACAFALAALPACSQTTRSFPGNQQFAPRSGFTEKTSTASTAAITTVDTSLLVKSGDDAGSVVSWTELALNLTDLTCGSVAIPEGTKARLTGGITVTRSTKGDGSTYITLDSSASASAVKITVTGTLAKGTLEIEPRKNSDIQILLSDASITSGNYPALKVDGQARTFLVLSGKNSLADGRSYGTGYSSKDGEDYYTASSSKNHDEDAELTQRWAEGDDTKATLYAKGSLIISGTGSLSVTEGYKHGIYSKDYIRVSGGTVTVENAGRTGIRSKNGFVMTGGTVTVNGTATHKEHPNDDSRGIIAEGDESADGAGKGYIYISGGTLTVNTTGKAVSAKWDRDDDAETASTQDDPNSVVMITGGTVTIRTTDAVVDSDWNKRTITYHDADGLSVTETEKCSPEGIEGKTGVIITGGSIDVRTTDDALNASLDNDGYVNILGGQLYLYATSADAIDSNGDINISGGTIVAIAPMGSEDGFDCDGGLSFTGGTAVGISGSSHAYVSEANTSNTQNAIVLGASYAGNPGSTVAITDKAGNAVFAFTIPGGLSSYGILTLTSPAIKSGAEYTVLKGAGTSGGTAFNGLYTSMPKVSGGSSTGTISTKSGTTVYTLGANAGKGPGMDGGPMGNRRWGEGDGMPPEGPGGMDGAAGPGGPGGFGGARRGGRGGQ